MLTGEEVRTLFDSIDCTTLIGLRDRALIATMAYTFGRIDAALKVKVEDVIHQQRRIWLRLHEAGQDARSALPSPARTVSRRLS